MHEKPAHLLQQHSLCGQIDMSHEANNKQMLKNVQKIEMLMLTQSNITYKYESSAHLRDIRLNVHTILLIKSKYIKKYCNETSF